MFKRNLRVMIHIILVKYLLKCEKKCVQEISIKPKILVIQSNNK